MKTLSSWLEKAKAFFKEDIWRLETHRLPTFRAVAIKTAKLLLLSRRGFSADFCSLRASALTLYTLLSIVPVFAMLFGIAKGFGMEDLLRGALVEQFHDQYAVTDKIMEFAQTLLAKTQGGLIAGVGVAVLFWSVMSVIGEIEGSFNHIWKVARGRTLARKVCDYLSLMLLAPTLLIISSSIAVYVQTRLSGLATAAYLPRYGSALLEGILGYLPLLIVWLLFSVTFVFMPNTKVDYASGVFAGVVAGTTYQLTQWAYISLQIGVSKYNAIYGSFAALPLFIVWLQTGWLILLFGAELAFHHQHFEQYENKDDILNGSFSLKKITALRIAHLLVRRFAAAEPPFSAGEIAQTLHLPAAVVQEITAELVKTHIAAEVHGEEEDAVCYQPARDIGLLRIATVIEALENVGGYSAAESEEFVRFKEITVQFSDIIRNSPANRLLKDIHISARKF